MAEPNKGFPSNHSSQSGPSRNDETFKSALRGSFCEGNDDLAMESGGARKENVEEQSDCERFGDSEYEFSGEEDVIEAVKQREDEWLNVTRLFSNKPTVNDGADKGAEIDKDGEETEDEALHSDYEFESHPSTVEEGETSKNKQRLVRFRVETDMADPQFKIGMTFSTRDEFKKACKHHGVEHGKMIRFKKNDKRRVKAFCKGCDWFISTAQRKDKYDFQIHSMNLNHKCGRTFNHGCATSAYLSEKYKNDIRLSNIGVGQLIEKVHTDINVTMSRNKGYLTKKKAKELIEGDYMHQYSKLHDYCAEIQRANPGSNIFFQTIENENGDEQFQRIYVCLNACKKGFLAGCRPVVGLDGCFLKGPHKGILLAAVGLDPNDQIYPIAYAVVEIENKITWQWFLRELRDDLKIYNPNEWTFITDKQKGLTNAIRDLLPGVEHRMCAWHMICNFKKVHSGIALEDRVWAAARASHTSLFVYEMETIKEMDESAYKWLEKNTSPKHWNRSHFRTTPKCDIMVNNICESFNSAILDAREKSILGLLEGLRFYLMVRMEKKRVFSSRFSGTVCPKIQGKLEKIKKKSNECFAVRAGELKFEIRCMYGDQYTVDLVARSCSCRKWDLNGIPFSHAVAAISTTGEPPENFVHDCYLKHAYERVYANVIYPINGEQLWEKTNKPPILPPERVALPGRPKKSRIKGTNEVQSRSKQSKDTEKMSRAGQMTYSCSICKVVGHNARKCPKKIVVDENVECSVGRMSNDQQNQGEWMNPDLRDEETTADHSVEPIQVHDHDTLQYVDDNAYIQPYASSHQTFESFSSADNPPKQVQKQKVIRCSLCRKLGHNRTNCGSTIAALYRPPEFQYGVDASHSKRSQTEATSGGEKKKPKFTTTS